MLSNEEDNDNDLNFSVDHSEQDDAIHQMHTLTTATTQFHNEYEQKGDKEEILSDVTRPAPLLSGPVQQWEADEREERRQVGGAAVAGGLAGLLVAGPLGALVVAGGAAVMATTNNKAGQATRSCGEAMAKAGDRLKKLDQKHHVSDKMARTFAKSADWVSDKLKPKRERERDAMYGLTA